MSTTTLYCSEAKRWNWQFSDWNNFTTSYNGYSNLSLVGYIPRFTDGASSAGVLMFSFDSLPANSVVTGATLHLNSVRYNGSSTHTVKFRVSNTYQAYTTSEPSGYQSNSISFTTTLTDRTVDITTQMQNYASAGSPCYVYLYESNPSISDYNTDSVQGVASATPYISLTYTVTTACSYPTSVGVSNTTPPPNTDVLLSWSGASGGDNNAIIGYDIYRSTSSGGTYSLLTSVSTTSTSGSYSVTSPTTVNDGYYYKVMTKGSAGVTYYSPLSGYAGLTSTATACSHPTSVNVSNETPDISTSVTLSWSGASGGTNNAITGYKIYRSTSSGGTYSELTANIKDVTTSNTSGTYSVTSPSSYNNSYFYKVRTIGTIAGYDSGNSSQYASVTSTQITACIAPTTIYPSVSNPEPNTSVTITWGSGTAGNGNAISGYQLYRDSTYDGTYSTLIGETDVSTLSSTVYSPNTDGQSYYYKVKTKGEAGVSYYSTLSTVYATITATGDSRYCSPPNALTISDGFPEPLDSIVVSWSGASAGVDNLITGYEIYEDSEQGGSFSTLTGSISTSNTYGQLAGISAAIGYNITKFYKVKTIGTDSGYDSGITTIFTSYKTCLYANYGITIPSIATLPVGIQYVVVYYDNTNIHKVSDDTVITVVPKETVLECSGVFNEGTTHYYIITGYSSSAYVLASNARSMTESEQSFYLLNGNTKSSVLVKQWTGSAWTTILASNAAAWSQVASSEIVQTANEISLKVSKGAIISEINQTAEQISISATKISLEGLITANNNFKVLADGSIETIDALLGGNLTSENTYCNNLLLRSGKEMTVGLWKIGNEGMYYPSGTGFNYLAFLYNGYNAYITAQAPMYIGPDRSNPLYVSGNGVTFTITNNDYSAGFIQDYYIDGGSQVLYQEICLVCNQAGDTYETAKGNLGTQTHRWDVLWVDTAHYNTHPSDSSILVKHDIANLRDVGEIIDKVRTVEFKYNNDSADRTRFGLIYEELVKILPELCRQDDKTGEFGIEYDDFIAVLLKQAQESRKKEKELEEKVRSLEDRLATLEKLLIK